MRPTLPVVNKRPEQTQNYEESAYYMNFITSRRHNAYTNKRTDLGVSCMDVRGADVDELDAFIGDLFA